MGDMKTKEFGPIPEKGGPNYPTSWLADGARRARVARDADGAAY